jgi:hypothetical protein
MDHRVDRPPSHKIPACLLASRRSASYSAIETPAKPVNRKQMDRR